MGPRVLRNTHVLLSRQQRASSFHISNLLTSLVHGRVASALRPCVGPAAEQQCRMFVIARVTFSFSVEDLCRDQHCCREGASSYNSERQAVSTSNAFRGGEH